MSSDNNVPKIKLSVNNCGHCRKKGVCYRASTPRSFARPLKSRFSCHSCLVEAGFQNPVGVREVVNCNVCKGSGLLPGANTFFQEYQKPKTFQTGDEPQKSLPESDIKLLGDRKNN